MNTWNTCIPPILGGFPCSQAHNLSTCDQPNPKDNFSPIKKYDILTHFDATAPLRLFVPSLKRQFCLCQFIGEIRAVLITVGLVRAKSFKTWKCFSCLVSHLIMADNKIKKNRKKIYKNLLTTSTPNWSRKWGRCASADS